MKYSDKQTARKIARLEGDLKRVYRMAWTDVSQSIDRYMASWAAQEKELKEKIESGKFTPPAGETAESYFRKWRINHIGMGKRWEAVRQWIVDRMVDANVHAAELINGAADGVYAVNRNYQAYQIEQYIPKTDIGDGRTMGVEFDLVNEKAVRHLESGKKKLLPEARVDIPKDQRWNMRKVQNEVLAGILAGKSVQKIAKDFRRVTDMNLAASLRNARTALGAAQCAGQQANIDEAAAMGIECMKEWMATLDDRTRDSHKHLDGTRIGKDDVFPNGCRYPCDPDGEPKEVYNCRCTLKTIVPGVNDQRGKRIAKDENGEYVYLDNVTYHGRDDSQSYAEWIENKIENAANEEQARDYADEARNEGIKTSAIDDSLLKRMVKRGKMNMDDAEEASWKGVVARSVQTIRQGFSAYNEDDKLHRYVRSIKPKDNYYDVSMHGTPTAVGFGTRGSEMATVTARELAAFIRHRDDYNDQPVRLLSCSTGKRFDNGEYCFAEELSNALGVEVIAPNDLLYINEDGSHYVGKYRQGKFETFRPNERGRIK